MSPNTLHLFGLFIEINELVLIHCYQIKSILCSNYISFHLMSFLWSNISASSLGIPSGSPMASNQCLLGFFLAMAVWWLLLFYTIMMALSRVGQAFCWVSPNLGLPPVSSTSVRSGIPAQTMYNPPLWELCYLFHHLDSMISWVCISFFGL